MFSDAKKEEVYFAAVIVIDVLPGSQDELCLRWTQLSAYMPSLHSNFASNMFNNRYVWAKGAE